MMIVDSAAVVDVSTAPAQADLAEVSAAVPVWGEDDFVDALSSSPVPKSDLEDVPSSSPVSRSMCGDLLSLSPSSKSVSGGFLSSSPSSMPIFDGFLCSSQVFKFFLDDCAVSSPTDNCFVDARQQIDILNCFRCLFAVQVCLLPFLWGQMVCARARAHFKFYRN